jgi:hypothetical protein
MMASGLGLSTCGGIGSNGPPMPTSEAGHFHWMSLKRPDSLGQDDWPWTVAADAQTPWGASSGRLCEPFQPLHLSACPPSATG